MNPYYPHFTVLLTAEKTLFALSNARCCPSKKLAFGNCLRSTLTFRSITECWPGSTEGIREPTTILLTGHQEFRLGKDRCQVKAAMIYHVDYTFRNTPAIEGKTIHNEHLKRLLMEDEVKIWIVRRREVTGRFRLYRHFTVTWIADKTLVVECTFPSPYHCRCIARVQKPSPITFRASRDFNSMKYHIDYPFHNSSWSWSYGQTQWKFEKTLKVEKKLSCLDVGGFLSDC